jgi:hypothetical protein
VLKGSVCGRCQRAASSLVLHQSWPLQGCLGPRASREGYLSPIPQPASPPHPSLAGLSIWTLPLQLSEASGQAFIRITTLMAHHSLASQNCPAAPPCSPAQCRLGAQGASEQIPLIPPQPGTEQGLLVWGGGEITDLSYPLPPTRHLGQMRILLRQAGRNFSPLRTPLPHYPLCPSSTRPPSHPLCGWRNSPQGRGPGTPAVQSPEGTRNLRSKGWVSGRWDGEVFSFPSPPHSFLGNARGRLGLECRA